MSFKITRAAIHNRNVYGLHKLVLIILADHEGNDYGSWPSVQRIADMAGISVRHAQRILRDLEEQGEIRVERQGGHRGTNRYFVVHKLFNRGDIFIAGGDTGVRGGDTQVTQGVTPMSPEHIKKAATAPAEPGRGSRNLTVNEIDSAQGEARPVDYSETENNDTPKHLPPRCLHNPLWSVLKCEQCSKQFREGEFDD
jgi:hypothetical protein